MINSTSENKIRVMETTLSVIVVGDKILLAEKLKGFAQGILNGAGGKVDANETVQEALIREVKEELDITITKFEKVGLLDFGIILYKGERVHEITHVFLITDFEGEPTQTYEMKPMWFNLDSVPYDKMFEGDRKWLPSILAGNKIECKFKYSDDWRLLDYSEKPLGKF